MRAAIAKSAPVFWQQNDTGSESGIIKDWLIRNAPGYGVLPEAGREALSSFVFLWSLLEGRALGTRASPAKLVEHARIWGEHGGLPTPAVTSALDYFRDRYLTDGALNDQFDSLAFRPNDGRGEVEAALTGRNQGPVEQAAAVLLIIYRLRNNLFHGVKWAMGLHDQHDNFEHANRVLIDAIGFPREGIDGDRTRRAP